MSNPLEVFYIEDDVSIAQAVKEYFEQLNYISIFQNMFRIRITNHYIWCKSQHIFNIISS